MKQQLLKTFLVFLVLFTTQETFSQNNILTLVNVIQKGTTDPNSKAKFTVTYKNTGSVTTDITGKPFQFRRPYKPKYNKQSDHKGNEHNGN